MSKHNYDIFISYRKRCSGDKPEMLQLMLEESGFRKRVSFDKDNLNGRFDVELIRRIDECKDFIMFMVPETFTTIRPLNEEAQRHRQNDDNGNRRVDRHHGGNIDPQQARDHEHVAVGEVDQAQDAVDHRVADGDERIQAAKAQRVRERLQQSGCVKHARYPPSDFLG